jgi:hypothetical protein
LTGIYLSKIVFCKESTEREIKIVDKRSPGIKTEREKIDNKGQEDRKIGTRSNEITIDNQKEITEINIKTDLKDKIEKEKLKDKKMNIKTEPENTEIEMKKEETLNKAINLIEKIKEKKMTRSLTNSKFFIN